MARIRTIKPEFWEDEKIGKLPLQARLLYIGTWNIADDNGVLRGNIAWIKSQVFPYDENLRIGEVKGWIDALVKARMLIPFLYREESYYVIRTFRSHQRIDTRYSNELIPNEILTEILPHDETTTSTQRDHDECTTSTRRDHSETTTRPQRDHDVGSGSGNGNGNIKENTNSDELVSKKDAAIAATNERKKAFEQSLVPYVDLYGSEMIRDFCDYWTEKNKSGTLMRYEKQPTWEIALRLKTWDKRQKEKSSAKREKAYESERVVYESDNERLRKECAERVAERLRRAENGPMGDDDKCPPWAV